VADLGGEVFGALRRAIEDYEGLVEVSFLDEVFAQCPGRSINQRNIVDASQWFARNISQFGLLTFFSFSC